MGDMGEIFKSVKEERRKKNNFNKVNSTYLLEKKDIEFVSKNTGTHLIVTGKDCLIDFWPSTGKFITRNGESGRGVFKLMKLCKGNK